MSQALEVMTAADSRELADKIARSLVERRLAACVQVVGPVKSTYRWKGNIETAEEWLCLIKTRQELWPEVERAIRAMHSYELPQIIALPIVAGGREYLDWLASETGSGA